MTKQLEYWIARNGDDYWQEYLTDEKWEVSALLVDCIQEFCDLRDGAKIVEFGAGVGRNLWALRQALPNVQLEGTDVHEGSLKAMIDAGLWAHGISYGSGIETVTTIAQRVHYGMTSDVVLSCAHFIHIPRIIPIAERMHKIIRKGGYLVLYESGGTLTGPEQKYWQEQVPGWFDRDYEEVFADTPLRLIHRDRHHQWSGPQGLRAYDVCVFQNGGEQ
jgi:hypothetical protein